MTDHEILGYVLTFICGAICALLLAIWLERRK